MGLTSRGFLVLVVLATIGLPVALLLLWSRVPGPRYVRLAGRLSLLLTCQAVAVLLALIAVNDQYLFFASWQDVLGHPPGPGAILVVGSQDLTGPAGGVTVSAGTSRTQRDGGQLITETVRGDRSQLVGRVLIHLPAGYATSGNSYPVIELLQGWHSPPETWIKNLDVLGALRAEERLGALGPVITVMPDINLATPRDVECTDVPGGPQAETWLTTDIRDLVLAQYRARSDARSWALMGFSTGGYCAAKFALHQPGWYHSAAVLSGYFEAVRDDTTGDLWGGSQLYRNENSPDWLLAHRPAPPIELLAFASRYDKESYPSTAHFFSLPHGKARMYSLIAPRGGHNYRALRAALPEMLGWVGGRLSTAPRT